MPTSISTTQPIPPFQTTFAVPLHCEACITSVTTALKDLPGIHTLTSSLPAQTLTITGTAPPSLLLAAIKSTGRDAILRGSGTSNSAAVCILEIPPPSPPASSPKASTPSPSPVRGLARLVQVSPTHTLIDLTLRGLRPGNYSASIRSSGDISRGIASLGGIWAEACDDGSGEKKGGLGEVEVDKDGKGSAVLMKRWQVWEVIGRGMVVEEEVRKRKGERKREEERETVMGVVARSAGVWDNEKTVCSCSGKTVWEEREEQVGRGML